MDKIALTTRSRRFCLLWFVVGGLLGFTVFWLLNIKPEITSLAKMNTEDAQESVDLYCRMQTDPCAIRYVDLDMAQWEGMHAIREEMGGDVAGFRIYFAMQQTQDGEDLVGLICPLDGAASEMTEALYMVEGGLLSGCPVVCDNPGRSLNTCAE